MKTITKTLATVGLSILLVGSLTNADAQGRGRGNGKDNNPGRGHDKSSWKNPGKGHDKQKHHDHDWRLANADRHDHHRHYDRDARMRHYHMHRHPVRWVSLQHSYIRPRYVFYRDYNVYYDYTRDVFISFSKGRWIVTADVPFSLRRVNFSNAVAVGVDYYDDDISTYVVRKRPVYFSVRAVF